MPHPQKAPLMKKSTDAFRRMPKENTPDQSKIVLDKLKAEVALSREQLAAINEKLAIINEELSREPEPQTVFQSLKAFQNMIDKPAALLDASLHLISANDTFYDTFQFTDQQATKDRPIYEIIGSPTDLTNWQKLLNKPVSSAAEPAVEFIIAHRFSSREEQLFKIRASGMFTAGKPAYNVMLIIENMGKSEKTDGSVQEDVGAFKMMADNAPVMIWLSDTTRKRIYFNKSWLRFTGKTLEEEQGHGWESGIHPEDLERSVNIFNTAFEKRESYKKEYRLKRKDGEYRWILSQGMPYFRGGKFSGYIGSCIDINYRVELELQKDEFLAVVSHELKTPLTTIEIYTDLLHQLLVKEDKQELAEFTGKINIQINKLILLIKEMLDISRITGKTLFLNKELLNVNTLLEEIVAEKQPIIKGHQLITRLNPVKEILGDRIRLVQVLDNIISNAVKYSPDARQVFIQTTQDGDWITIMIRDEGVGIPLTDQKKIFKRFFRSEETAKTFPGIGLGLYISHEIIRRHKGKIEVDSHQGEGSAFRIKLPAAIHEPEVKRQDN